MAGVRALMLNKSFIAEDVTKYINVNYPFHTFDKLHVKKMWQIILMDLFTI